jgi:hypothetical protein
VYRDVGSEPHEPGDADFVDIYEIPWEPEAALLLCSDGLSDLVPSEVIRRTVSRLAGQPAAVVRALVKEANDAGGKDNVTAVYVEGERFPAAVAPGTGRDTSRALAYALVWLMLIAAGLFGWRAAGYPLPDAVISAIGVSPDTTIVVQPGGSIAAALARAVPGASVLVEPGEYHERLTLRDHIRVVSRVPRGATLRLPGGASDEDAAVMAVGVINAELAGFRIVGDAATPLGTGILTRSSSVALLDLEIAGAARTAIDLGPGFPVALLGSDIHDNPGVGLAVRANATPRITHNVFSRNGTSEQVGSAVAIEPGARPVLQRNIFHNVDPFAMAHLDETLRAQLKNDNWFPDVPPPQTTRPARGPAQGRSGR